MSLRYTRWYIRSVLCPFSVEPPIAELCYWEAISISEGGEFCEIQIFDGSFNVIASAIFDTITNNISEVESDLETGLIANGYIGVNVIFSYTAPNIYAVTLENIDLTETLTLRTKADAAYDAIFQEQCSEPNLELLEDGLPALLENGDYSLLEI